MENASFRFSYKDVKKSIQTKTEEGWEFIFAGANIDACKTAESIGISRDKALNYNANKNTKELFSEFSYCVSSYVEENFIDPTWARKTEEKLKK